MSHCSKQISVIHNWNNCVVVGEDTILMERKCEERFGVKEFKNIFNKYPLSFKQKTKKKQEKSESSLNIFS